MRVCITGAASLVAEELIERLKPDHDLTLLDIQFPDKFPGDIPRLTGSILDRAFLKQAFKRQHAVIHLAVAHEEPKLADTVRWKVNVEGTLAVVEEAIVAGVRKLIYASSLSVLEGHDLSAGAPGDECAEPKQKSFYALTKYLGENIVKYHAERHGLRSVALRYTSVVPDLAITADMNAGQLSPVLRTTNRDVAQAFQLALEKNLNSMFELFHISNAHPNGFWSHEKATRMLGYQPLDG